MQEQRSSAPIQGESRLSPEWFDMVSRDGLGDTETFQATYDICRMLLARGVPGDFVECGVFKGANPALMARALMDQDCIHTKNGVPSRRVHLFDTFAGLPAPSEHDIHFRETGHVGGEAAFSLEDVKVKMHTWGIPEELLVYHVGRVEDTVLTMRHGPIAFLRLDMDLHDATAACIEHLLPLVPRGGWVCVDDFNLDGCQKAVLTRIVPAPIYWRVPTK